MKSQKICSVFFLVVFFFGIHTLKGQFIVTPNSHDFNFSNVDLETNEEFQYKSFMSNLTEDTLLINWEILDASFPEEWYVYIADPQLSYLVDLLINTNDGRPTHPLIFTPNLEDALFNFVYNPREAPGCGEVSIKVFNYETNEIYDTLNFNIKVNTEDCALVSTEDLIHGVHQIKVFPNPTYNFVTLEGITKLTAVTITNTNGQTVLKKSISKNQMIDISSLSSGIYFLYLINDNNYFEMHKLVKD